jgi:hypothetical protein
MSYETETFPRPPSLEMPPGKPPKILGWLVIAMGILILPVAIFFLIRSGVVSLAVFGAGLIACGFLLIKGSIWGLILYGVNLLPIIISSLISGPSSGLLGGLVIHGVLIAFMVREAFNGNLE